MCLEILNSSIEKLSDFVEPNTNQKIKIIKDTAAAAVLVAAAIAFIVGILIFYPYFFTQEWTSLNPSLSVTVNNIINDK